MAVDSFPEEPFAGNSEGEEFWQVKSAEMHPWPFQAAFSGPIRAPQAPCVLLPCTAPGPPGSTPKLGGAHRRVVSEFQVVKAESGTS